MLAFKGNFSYCCGKVENSGSMEHFVKEFSGPEKALGHVEIWEKNCLLLKDIVRIDEGRERKERSTRAGGLEDTFGGKINVGEEYEGQNKYRFPEFL